MECFYHPAVAAAGICKNCHRGICRECAVELEDGIACPNRCEAQVGALSRAWRHNALYFAVLGGFLMSMGIVMAADQADNYADYHYYSPAGVGISVVGLIVGTLFFVFSYRMRRRNLASGAETQTPD
jgi:hypothetical protein